MIHGGGSYQSDEAYTADDGVPVIDVPFYSQSIRKYCDDGEGECAFASWAQPGPIPVAWQSTMLNFNRYKDCGNGKKKSDFTSTVSFFNHVIKN